MTAPATLCPTGRSEPRICTTYVYPPIPMRGFDWMAYLDGDEEGMQAYGATEREAITALQEKIAEAEGRT